MRLQLIAYKTRVPQVDFTPESCSFLHNSTCKDFVLSFQFFTQLKDMKALILNLLALLPLALADSSHHTDYKSHEAKIKKVSANLSIFGNGID
jgi:hypothetical protein